MMHLSFSPQYAVERGQDGWTYFHTAYTAIFNTIAMSVPTLKDESSNLNTVTFQYVVKVFFDRAEFWVWNFFLVQEIFTVDEEVLDIPVA